MKSAYEKTRWAKALLLLTITLTTKFTVGQVIPNIDWVKYYSEKNQIANVPSAIDANNNVYVTGYTYVGTTPDITTLKYDAAGTLLWSVHYNNGGTDQANAITLDQSGNVYVTGFSDGTTTGNDYVTIKYDANGNQVWATRYNGTGNSIDRANAILVSTSGEVYVTGSATNTSGNTDYLTIKYNASGVQQWTRAFNGTGNGNDVAVAIGLAGNRIFVTGTSRSSANQNDITTLRINANTGAIQGSASINGTANSNDQAYSLLVDGNDFLVCGAVTNTSTQSDYSLVKYNGNNGSLVWSKTYNSYGSFDAATSIVKDATNNYVVTGLAANGSLYEYHTILYNANGVQQWVNKNQTNLPYYTITPKIAVDDIANHFYVCGEINTNGNDILVYQITPSGNKTWQETFNGANSGQDAAVDLTVNSQGVIYIAGASYNSNAKYDYTTIRISQTPTYFPPDYNSELPLRNFAYLRNNGQLFNTLNQPVTDVKYYTEAGGSLFYIKNTGYSIVNQKLDTSRTHTNDSLTRVDVQFEKSNTNTKAYNFEDYSDLTNFYQSNCPQGIEGVIASKRLMIPNIYPNIDLHYYSNQNGIKYYFVVKPGGDPNSIKHLFTGANSTSINGSGKLDIVTTLGKTTFDVSNAYQVNMSGQAVPLPWQASWVNSGTNTYKFNIGAYVTALPLIIQVDQGNTPLSVASTSNPRWSTYYGKSGVDYMFALDSDSNGDVYATGLTSNQQFPHQNQFYGGVGGGFEAFLFKFSAFGEPIWRTMYGGDGMDRGHGIKVDELNNFVYFSGGAWDADNSNSAVTNFPVFPLAGAYNKTAVAGTGQKDYGFIGKVIKTTGQRQWFTLFGEDTAPTLTYLGAIDVDQSGNVYVVGKTIKNNNFPIVTPVTGCPVHTQNITGVYSGCIAKFDAANQLVWSTTFGNDNTSIEDIDVNSVGEIFITGSTSSTNVSSFPLKQEFTNDVMNSYAGGSTDGFVAKFSDCLELKWSTLYGGSGMDVGWGIEISEGTPTPNKLIQNNQVSQVNTFTYICGRTTSANFPYLSNSNTNSINDNTVSGTDGFIVGFNALNESTWSTYVGGTGYEQLFKLEFDDNGILYLIGETNSVNALNVPLSGAYNQSQLENFGGGNERDAYLLALNGVTNFSKQYATFYGGDSPSFPSDDYGGGISTSLDYVFICGQAGSSNYFPLNADLTNHPSAYLQSTLGSGQDQNPDAFIATLEMSQTAIGIIDFTKEETDLSVFPNPSSGQFCIKFENGDFSDKFLIEVIDLQGKVVYSQGALSISGTPVLLNLSHLSEGMYIIKVQDDKQRMSKKLILNK